MALRSGEVDMIENPPPHELASFEKNENFYVYVSPKNRTLFVSFNMEDKNVGGEQNRAFREAIAYAINPQEIVDYILEGLALVLDKGFIPEAIAKGSNDPSLVRKHDVEKAKQILKEAGIEPGRKVEFWVSRGRYLLDTATGEVIQAQLSKVGIIADVIVMQMGPMVNALSKHEEEMYQMGFGWITGDPHQTLHQLFSSEGVFSFSAFYNEKFDQLLEKASATFDWNEKMELYNKAYKILFDDVVLVPILTYKNIYAANKKVKGFFAGVTEIAFFDEVYIEE
jgi:peptide/nickel transport system substrate-binding protein